MKFFDLYQSIAEYLGNYFVIHSLKGLSLVWAIFLALSIVGAIRIVMGMIRVHRGELLLQKDRIEMGLLVIEQPQEEPEEPVVVATKPPLIVRQSAPPLKVIPRVEEPAEKHKPPLVLDSYRKKDAGKQAIR